MALTALNEKNMNAYNLYLLTNSIGTFYVLGIDPTSAQVKLEALLDKADYGLSGHRKVTNIELVAESLGEFPEGRPFFSSGHRLIL